MPKITTVNSTEESILQITLFFFSCVTLKDLLRSNSILSLKFLNGNMEISLAMPKSSFGDNHGLHLEPTTDIQIQLTSCESLYEQFNLFYLFVKHRHNN